MKTLYFRERLQNVPIMVKPDQSATVSAHKHDFFEFVYVSSGRAEHIFENKSVIVSKGDYFLINLGSTHEYRKLDGEENFSVINLLFLPRLIDESLKDAANFQEIVDHYLVRYGYDRLGELPTQKIFHDDTGAVENLLSVIVSEYEKKETGYVDIIRHLLLTLIIQLVRRESTETVQRTDATVKRIKQYVAEHYMQPLRLSDICRRMNFSLPYISSLFREKTGMTFREYLLKLRMEKACFLLRSSDMTVQNIAASVGYNDPAFFYKSFRRFMRNTPEGYRSSMKNHVYA